MNKEFHQVKNKVVENEPEPVISYEPTPVKNENGNLP